MDIRPIETRYAGCRFRSRLEARWAVFFDTLGVRWEYETQGFDLEGFPYLPDFLLPDCGTWVEVKGAQEHLDKVLMHRAAHLLPEVKPQLEPGPRLLVLGPIPRPVEHGDWGYLGLDPWREGDPREPYPRFGRYGFGLYYKNHRPWSLYGTPDIGISSVWKIENWLSPELDADEPGAPEAYRAARSARFEHGESG